MSLTGYRVLTFHVARGTDLGEDAFMASVTENGRITAARIVAAWLRTGDFPDRMLDTVSTHRPFVMEAVLGVVRRYGALHWMLRRCARREPDPAATAAVLTGLYELLFMDDVQPFATVHEAVEAARQIGGEGAARFANALLRRAAESKSSWLAELERQPPPVRLSHPPVLYERWIRQFGQRNAIRLCQWNNERPEVSIRPLPPRATAAALLTKLKRAGIEAEPHPHDPARFLMLPRGVAVADLPGYAEGDFYVQDPATAAAVDLLDPRPGERILDACAAPGGKTILIAERLANTGILVAADLHEDRLDRLRENLARVGHSSVRIRRLDAATARIGEFRDALGGAAGFDAVLLDAPCSNTGVIRRRPDARWNFSLGRLAKLRALQERLLDNAARWVVPGGRLLYSTCSLEPEEDEDLVLSWTTRHPGWTPVRARKLFPPDTRTDGAYIALLKRATPLSERTGGNTE